MRVLVTGGGGYLGSALVRDLVARGHEVYALDHWAFGNGRISWIIPWAPGASELVLDVRSDRVGRLIERERIDAVIHLAAILTVKACENDPELAHSVHIDGTASAFSVPGTRNIYISTGAVFGEGGQRVEDDPVTPLTVYSRTKALAEEVALRRNATVLRLNYMGGYAPGTRWVETVNFLARDAAVFGEVCLWEPHITHPFTHVLDAVDAIVAVLEHDECRGDVFHVLSEVLRRDEFARYAKQEDAKVTKKVVGHLKHDLFLDTSKIEKALGWTPKRKLSDAFHDAATAARGVTA